MFNGFCVSWLKKKKVWREVQIDLLSYKQGLYEVSVKPFCPLWFDCELLNLYFLFCVIVRAS